MPATRSSSEQRSTIPEVIVLSSDDEDTTPVATIPEVIILSSDDEDAPGGVRLSLRFKGKLSKKPSPMTKAPGKDGSSWERENSKLKQMNEHLERQVAGQRIRLDNSKKRLEEQSQELAARSQEINACHKEIQLQQEKLAALEAKELTIDATKLDNTLSCNICTDLMYSPYLYCEGCLKGWFNETLTKHIRAHPAYNVHRKPLPQELPQILNIIGPYVSRRIQMQLQALYNDSRQPQPEYTCPACRKEVTGKPVVNFAVKDMVSTVGSVLGRPDTRQESSNIRGQQAGPFDGFFPR